MKRLHKRVLIFTIIGVVLFACKVGYDIITALHMLKVEDDIAQSYRPVAKAIETYHTKNGSLPASLNSLIPEYFQVMPASRYADSIEYKVLPNNKWVLGVHSTTLKPSRIYSFRSDYEFTDDERARLIREYHEIAVLRDK